MPRPHNALALLALLLFLLTPALSLPFNWVLPSGQIIGFPVEGLPLDEDPSLPQQDEDHQEEEEEEDPPEDPVQGPGGPSEWTDDATFREAIRGATNTYRRQHGANDVDWNYDIASTAQQWADSCIFEHTGGPTGENLATGYATPTAAITAWASERSSYSYGAAGFSMATGHFSQLVWRATRTVGCGRRDCGPPPEAGQEKDEQGRARAYGWYLVCEYDPPGNVEGQFGENVLAG